VAIITKILFVFYRLPKIIFYIKIVISWKTSILPQAVLSGIVLRRHPWHDEPQPEWKGT